MNTLIYNGKIYVERENFVQALYIRDEKIIKIGTDEEVISFIEEIGEKVDKKIDCEGQTVIPGLNDSHQHLLMYGENLRRVKISDVRSIDELVDRCRKFIEENKDAVKSGLRSMGWNQDLFTEGEKRIPTRYDLDKISTEIPIILDRVCSHILVTNTKVIEMLGLDENSKQYAGGEFFKDADGYPNGVFAENACNYVKDIIPEATIEEKKEMIIEAMARCAQNGVTSVQSNDVGTSIQDADMGFKMLHEIYDEGLAPIRYTHQVCFNDIEKFKQYVTEGEYRFGKYDGQWLKLGPLKLFRDGSLGGRTAWLKKDYHDDKGNRGIEWTSREDMINYCKFARENDIQVITHVIGDMAIEDTVKCYESIDVDGENPLRNGLVHCQITDEKIVERIGKSNITVLTQPIFLDYDINMVEDRVGKELASTSYAFKSLKDKGAHVAYGTDAPVEDVNPFPVIYMAVTRKKMDGEPKGGFYKSECVDVYEAIDAYTYESAFVEFMEDKKGRLKEGYLADMVILDRDIFTIDSMEIKDVKPVMTIVGGNIVYDGR